MIWGLDQMKRATPHLVALAFLPTIAWGQAVSFDVAGDNERLTEILQSASLVESLDPTENPAPQDYIAAARADYRRLLTALYSRGYSAGTISISVNGLEASNIAPLDAPSTISTIAYAVDPGKRFTFGKVSVAPIPAGTLMPESFTSGAIARSGAVTEAVASGVDAWRNSGHAKAAAGDQQISARHSEEVLDVAIKINEGPQLTFGELTITGNKDVRSARIAKIAGLPVGQTYAPQDLLDAERRLRKTGAFDSVTAVEAENIGANNTLPIEMKIVESRPRRIGFGLELSSIEGVKVSTYWMHRNFLGGAERFRVDGEVSGIGGETGGIDYKLSTSLERPAVYGADTDLYTRIEVGRTDEPSYLIDYASLEFGLTRPIGEDITASAGIGYLGAREVSDIGTRTFHIISLPLGATIERRDEPTNAKKGYYINAEVTPFTEIDAGAGASRIFVDARAYKTFGESQNMILAARTQVGTVLGGDVENTPDDFLFYSGGGGTVRGQSYDSLAVERVYEAETYTTGGSSFAGAQLEARYSVTDSIGLVGFYDVGQITAGEGWSGNSQWHAGAGVGVRYNTGIGPIRLDIGTPASGDNIGKNVQVYIGIGQSF